MEQKELESKLSSKPNKPRFYTLHKEGETSGLMGAPKWYPGNPPEDKEVKISVGRRLKRYGQKASEFMGKIKKVIIRGFRLDELEDLPREK